MLTDFVVKMYGLIKDFKLFHAVYFFINIIYVL